MTRHRQKDAEGSELMTRKRAWKDPEGRIVKKRPFLDSTQDVPTTEVSQTNVVTVPLPPSPPGSASSNLAASPSQLFDPTQTYHDGFEQVDILQPCTFEATGGQDLFWESIPPLSDPGHSTGPLDDIFMPDTASSFNMPYTTMTNYNWLFDLSLDPEFHSDTSLGLNVVQNDQPRAPPQQGHSEQIAREKHQNAGAIGVSSTQGNGKEKLSCSSCYQSPRKVLQETPMCLLEPNKQLPTLCDLTRDRILKVIDLCRPTSPDGNTITSSHQLLTLASLQSYLDLFFTRFNTVYPLIHLSTFNPTSIEPILLLSAILLGATYADKEAHQLAVCIHDVLRPYIFSCPGFNARAELPILQAILLTECLGKSRAGQRQHDMSHLFHGLLINLIRRSECQTADPETVGKDLDGDIESHWRKWADLESKKRLAQICFIWDVQHAVLFSQSLCMSAFELRTALPCDQSVWEATSPLAWKVAWKTQKQTSLNLLAVLKSYLSPHREVTQRDLNAISRIVILHGLMSISWDMERRDQTSLGSLGNGIVSGSWRERMIQSYDLWKADFDRCMVDMKLQLPPTSKDPVPSEELSWRQGLATYEITSNAIYHAASLVLLSEILDLQIYGGARHILGRPVSRADYARSQKIVKRWATETPKRAIKATWHSACLLRDFSESKEEPFISVDVFHHPWTIFLASLTLWAFYQARPADSTDNDDEMIWDAKKHMKELLDGIVGLDCHGQELLVVPMIHRGSNCTAGLTATVVGHLSKIRWAVVHDGMMVLKGLVPWRLICEDDGRK
ncbi:related to C2H2 zinc finger protein [Ramularia collo-cygni]|uniref:Related to C2H2 zinc finger protein n=1 Tax=Ramularia collo-cygni TaxID=112498 RepID=A0A2D3V5P8_9PEZI|nr:related to C2H2 zinc finger protein [Ramularia collo-cygni]CZT22005.1 related to C2H2 zinc finger protein [Ramularia collo-cygni]